MHMRRTIWSSVSCPALKYFPTLSLQRHDFRKELLSIKYVFWFVLLLCLKYISFWEEHSELLETHKVVMWSTRYSSQILMKLGFSWQIFEKNPQISNVMKIRPVEAEYLHADGQTDMTKLKVASRKFLTTRLKMEIRCTILLILLHNTVKNL